MAMDSTKNGTRPANLAAAFGVVLLAGCAASGLEGCNCESSDTTSPTSTGSSGGTASGGAAGGGGQGGAPACPVERQCADACCAEDEWCVAGECAPSCQDGVLCGDPVVCCAPGEECLAKGCVPACPSGVRCGADLLTCCQQGEVCVSAKCVSPGKECIDSFDCGLGSFCEPTLQKCLPQFDPVTCEYKPAFFPFEPVLEWSWTQSAKDPEHVQSVTTPLVIDLDQQGSPEVVINASLGGWLGMTGRLRALAGDSGVEKWTNQTVFLNGPAAIAAGDVDGDGYPEIVGIASTNQVVCFEHTGELKWTAAPVLSGVDTAGPSIADLDGDGSPEIVVGALVLDADGKVVWDHGAAAGSNAGYPGGFTAIADVDLDGKPEVIPGAKVYDYQGKLKFDLGADGYPAVANFDADPQAEIVLVANGVVTVYDGTSGKADFAPVTIPGGGRGGPPTVADFNGDGQPEIGVAGGASYVVIDPDAQPQVVWASPTQDMSSNVTGSSVFDFEGDGSDEVVYADECYLRVYKGADGKILMEVPNSSGTGHENPLVADVDGDGNSEVVVVANNWSCGHGKQFAGVFVYGDSHDHWVPTRRVWNQHAYHVTNVGALGSIPAVEQNNWQVADLNNYRTNVQGEGVFNAPDLALDLAVAATYCQQAITLTATVKNLGSLGVAPGVAVAFYWGKSPAPDKLIGTAKTTKPLLPGQSEAVSTSTPVPEGQSGPFDFLAVVDPDPDGGKVAECLEDNNTAAATGVKCASVR
ncbi:MAG: VCBS repeat-containing protein [Deltaproteobacteria bacterium]|nr:VCBS repeat-containing protein [Deltaproteobacteria bacterium]